MLKTIASILKQECCDRPRRSIIRDLRQRKANRALQCGNVTEFMKGEDRDIVPKPITYKFYQRTARMKGKRGNLRSPGLLGATS